MPSRMVGNKIGFTVFVTPETYCAMEEARGILKRSTYCGMVLEELFNPKEENVNAKSRCN